MKGVDWNSLVGKNIFTRLKSGKHYNGRVTEVVDTGDGLIWIHIIDMF